MERMNLKRMKEALRRERLKTRREMNKMGMMIVRRELRLKRRRRG